MKIKSYRTTPEVYPLHRVRVIDGDTIEADIVLAFDTRIQRRIRLKGWWADEVDGPFRSSALEATFRLEAYLAEKAIWLHAPSCRVDKYGRVIGHLMYGERIVDPRDVLKELQLSEATHKLRRDQAAASRKQAKAWPEDKGPTKRPDPEDLVTLGHPSPFMGSATGAPVGSEPSAQ